LDGNGRSEAAHDVADPGNNRLDQNDSSGEIAAGVRKRAIGLRQANGRQVAESRWSAIEPVKPGWDARACVP